MNLGVFLQATFLTLIREARVKKHDLKNNRQSTPMLHPICHFGRQIVASGTKDYTLTQQCLLHNGEIANTVIIPVELRAGYRSAGERM